MDLAPPRTLQVVLPSRREANFQDFGFHLLEGLFINFRVHFWMNFGTIFVPKSLQHGLQNLNKKSNDKDFTVMNPEGCHALCVGLVNKINVTINGHVGYYCAGMNQNANIIIKGNVSTGVAENMMSGTVHVKGNASQSAGATAHGGLLIIDGNASSRCGISMKGVNIVVKGSVGHMSALSLIHISEPTRPY